ncbi:MAG: hypothetical protein WBE36_16620 [Terracidiphilus sp.]
MLPLQGVIALAESSAQLSFQFLEFRLFVADDRQLVPDEIPHFHARVGVPILDGEKFAYLSERKSQGLGSFHKCQAIDRQFVEYSVTRCGPRWRSEQTFLLVKAHGFQVDLGALRELASCQSFHDSSLNPVGFYRVK